MAGCPTPVIVLLFRAGTVQLKSANVAGLSYAFKVLLSAQPPLFRVWVLGAPAEPIVADHVCRFLETSQTGSSQRPSWRILYSAMPVTVLLHATAAIGTMLPAGRTRWRRITMGLGKRPMTLDSFRPSKAFLGQRANALIRANTAVPKYKVVVTLKGESREGKAVTRVVYDGESGLEALRMYARFVSRSKRRRDKLNRSKVTLFKNYDLIREWDQPPNN
jgi:hypothetical protein